MITFRLQKKLWKERVEISKKLKKIRHLFWELQNQIWSSRDRFGSYKIRLCMSEFVMGATKSESKRLGIDLWTTRSAQKGLNLSWELHNQTGLITRLVSYKIKLCKTRNRLGATETGWKRPEFVIWATNHK